MRFSSAFVIFVMATTSIAVHGAIKDQAQLTEKEKNNTVRVLMLTPDKESAEHVDEYFTELEKAVVHGIKEVVAELLEKDQAELTVTIVLNGTDSLADFDFSTPLEFFVSMGGTIVEGSALASKARDIAKGIQKEAKDRKVKLSVDIVKPPMKGWGIALIAIAASLLVGAVVYLIYSIVRKQRGNPA